MSKKTCVIEGCDELVLCKDLCRTHYKNWYRYGHPLGDPRKAVCTHQNCLKIQFLAGLCSEHFEEKFKDDLKKERIHRVCRKKDCNLTAFIKGFCNEHYQELQIHGSFVLNTKGTCIHPDCQDVAVIRNLCSTHYRERKNELDIENRGRYVVCKVEGCSLPIFREDLCFHHFRKKLKNTIRNRNKKVLSPPVCKEPSCKELAGPSGYCSLHRLLHKTR